MKRAYTIPSQLQQPYTIELSLGAVCPLTGETEALIALWVDKEVMQKHLALISKRTRADRHTVVIMDGAGRHTDDIAAEFKNLNIIKLPPYSPELNPIEQIWQWLRQRKLANRCFKDYEDIVEQCSKAWNSFISDIDLVKKLCSRKWATMFGS